MRYSTLISRLQNLTKNTPSVGILSKATGLTEKTLYARKSYDREFSEDEIKKIEDFYAVTGLLTGEIIKSPDGQITLDYYPDVFGSCGNGVFQFSTKREQVLVPKSALFKNFTPGKQYFVINAMGNSMQPTFYDKDKLIVENYDGEQIIDNKPYVFCYKDEIYIKRLAKNVDQLIIISDNKDYDSRKLEGAQLKDVNIIGQIVGLMRDLR